MPVLNLNKKRIFILSLILSGLIGSITAVNAQEPPVVDSAIRILDTVITEPDSYVTDEDKDDDFDYFLKKDANDPYDNVEQRKISKETIQKMKSDDDFWYADAEIKKEKEKVRERTPLGQQKWFRTLLLVLIIAGFGAFLAIYLAGSNVGLFRKRDRTLPPGEERDEIATEDIFAINYQKEIDKAASQGNFRLAVRLMFLRLLRNLSERNIIRYSQDKTNFDYLLQLHPTKYYANFFKITRNYEYSWYGHFEVNEDAYKIIRQDVDQMEKEIRL